MAHDYELVITDPMRTTTLNGVRSYWSCTGGLSFDVPNHYHPKSSGSYWTRDKSHHTVRDRFGWRAPQPYFAKKIVSNCGLWNNKVVDVSYLTCTADGGGYRATPWNIGGGSHAYWYSYGQTPLTRAYGSYQQNLENWCITKAIAKLNKSSFSLLVSVGEAREAYRMVVSLLQDMRRFFQLLGRGKIPAALQKLRRGMDPVQLWLSYRYGWAQLFYDVQNLLELAEQLSDGTYDMYRVYVKSGIKSLACNLQSEFSDTVVKVISRTTGTESCMARMDFRLKDATYVTRAAIGLHPLPAAWELLRWSFVADWALNIGKMLEAWTYLPGWTYIGGSVSTFGRYKHEYELIPAAPRWKVSHSRSTGSSFEFQRRVISSPTPTLAINPEVLQGLFSKTRITDAVMLLAQTLRNLR